MPRTTVLSLARVSLSGTLPLSVRKQRPGMRTQKCSSSLGRVFKKKSVPWSPAGPLFLLGPTRGSQKRASHGRTVFAHLSPRAPVLPASGLSIQASPPADGVDTRAALRDEFWPGVCGDWAVADWSRGRAAQRRAHSAGRAAPGARSSAHSAFNTMDRVAQSLRAVSPSASPRGVLLLSPARFSPWSVHRMLPDPPLPHFIWLPTSPRASCPGAQKLLQARRKTWSRLLKTTRPLLPPEPWYSSTASALSN